jgi:hypothetical protein
MRIFLGIAIVVISVIIFRWWGLLSLTVALPLIGWKARHKGPFPTRQRWSICFSYKGDVKYELTHQRAMVLIGFVMSLFYTHKKPKDDWEVHIVFNKKDVAFSLSDAHFPNDQIPDKELSFKLTSLDPNHSSLGSSSEDPIFFSRSPYKIIPLSHALLSWDEMIKLDETNSEETFFDKMKEVFG